MTPILWPDFDGAALADALASYAARQRRFGLTGEQAQAACSSSSSSSNGGGSGSGERAAAVAPAAATAAVAQPSSSSSSGASGSSLSSSPSLYAGYSSEYVSALIASSAAEGGADPAKASAPLPQQRVRVQPRFNDVGVLCRTWVAALVAWLVGIVVRLLPLQWARDAASATTLAPGRSSGCSTLWAAQSRSRLGGRKRSKKPSIWRTMLPVVSALAFLVASVAAAYVFRPALRQIQTRVAELWQTGSSQESAHVVLLSANEAQELLADRTAKGHFATSQSQAPSSAPAYSAPPDSPVASPPMSPDAEGDASDVLPLHIPLWCVSSPAEMAELGQAAAGWAHSAGRTCAASPPPSASAGGPRGGGASGNGLGLRSSSPVVTPFVSATASQQSMKDAPASIERQSLARTRLDAADARADPINFAVAASDVNRTRRRAIAAQSVSSPWHHSPAEAAAS